jgi:purine-binding chemotaxis protein CheW
MSAIDWDEIVKRMESALAAIDQISTLTPEEKRGILKARARSLAGGQKDAKEQARAVLEVVEFLLADERYAIETSFIREIFPLGEITPLPCTPAFIVGIINFRGQILSVIDIKKFFDLDESNSGDLKKLLIVRDEESEMGFLADDIVGSRSILLEEIQPSLPTLTGIREEYFRGVTNERIAILDVAKILSDKRIIVHEEVE